MPKDNVPGNNDEEQEEIYENLYPVELQGNKDDVEKRYEVMENDFICQKIYQDSKRRQSVYGEANFPATGNVSCGQWNPSFRKGVSSYPPETQDFILEDFYRNDKEILTRLANTPADQRNPKHVEFLLHTVLPDLETKLAKSGISQDILTIILRLSCFKKCSEVTRYALHIILDILSKTSYDSAGIFGDFIVQCEISLKDSIVSQVQGETSIFDLENAEDKGLRLFVYSRTLMILFANIVQGLISLAAIDEIRDHKNFDNIVQKLTNLEKQNLYAIVKKDKARYAIRCIKETVSRLSEMQHVKQKGKKNCFHKLLVCLKEHNSTGTDENKKKRNESVKDFISEIKVCKKGWFELHIAVFCLASQIHQKPKNIDALRILIDAYLKKHSDCAKKWSKEGEWQTGLVLANVLEHLANFNQDKDTRAQACLSLINYFRNLTGRNSLEKLWVKESLNRCLYGPDRNLRQVIFDHLEIGPEASRENMKELIPITRAMDYLEQRYKRQLQPGSRDFIGTLNFKGYFTASFRGEKATVKILPSSKDDLVREEKKTPSKAHQQLVLEAYALRRLNSKPHPNILRVFAYDTSAQPYHLITEHVSKGSLLQFLQSSRLQTGYMPSPSTLIKMILGVMDAVIYLNEQHLVHLAIMASNILVSMDNVCKLTGFQFARQMTKQSDGSYEYVSILDEMAIRHAAPECFTSGRFSEKSVSWAIGICLFEMHTYGVSPYNQFTNKESDQIRSHVTGGGKLVLEDCIRKEVCEMISKCLQFEREKRPTLTLLKRELADLYDQLTKEENDWPSASYPSLTNVDRAQTENTMDSSYGIECRDKEKNLGFFGSPTISHDIPMIRVKDGVRFIRELVEKTKEADLKKLKSLKHKNIVKVLTQTNYDAKYIALETEDSARGNLLQMVLDKQCKVDVLVTFASQTGQAMEYMHENGMIHTDLRGEHIMVFCDKVKVTRLGRSEQVNKMVDTHCPEKPKDGIRWKAPEVIKDSIHSHSSDVYSFGVTFFELFNALSAPKGSKPEDVQPFSTIKNEQILAYLEGDNRPERPDLMPIWFYLMIKQCLLHKPVERPPFPLLNDTLTYRKPYKSCLLSHWTKIHKNEVANIDTNVAQPERAGHLIPKEEHKSFKELESLAAVEVFLKHTYSYKPGNMDAEFDVQISRDLCGILQDKNCYDDIYSYNNLHHGKREYEDSGENIYDRIWPKGHRLQDIPLPPPPPPFCPSDKTPIQESGDSTLASERSEWKVHGLSKKDKKTSDHMYDTFCYPENNGTSPLPWPSLPSPNNNGSANKYERLRFSPCRRGSFGVPQTSLNARQIPEVSATLSDEPSVNYDDEGAVGGEPVESSFYSMNPQWISMNDNGSGATECSWHSLRPLSDQEENGTRYMDEIDHSATRDEIESRRHPVPVPRRKGKNSS